MYLNDQDLIKALVRCREGLTINEKTGDSGLIIVKENVKPRGAYIDKEDSSITRSPEHFKAIFDSCGLEIIHTSS